MTGIESSSSDVDVSISSTTSSSSLGGTIKCKTKKTRAEDTIRCLCKWAHTSTEQNKKDIHVIKTTHSECLLSDCHIFISNCTYNKLNIIKTLFTKGEKILSVLS